jgi:uncharacterized protein
MPTRLIIFVLAGTLALEPNAVPSLEAHQRDVSAVQTWLRALRPVPDKETFARLGDWLRSHPDDAETLYLVARSVNEKQMSANGRTYVDGRTYLQLLEESAKGGFAPAQATLGMVKLRGDGLPQDIEGGRKLLQAALDQNCIEAVYLKGALLEEGAGGFTRDPSAARTLLRSAADGGMVKAWSFWALAEARLKNSLDAVGLMEKGSAAGDPQAQAILAGWHFRGYLVPRDTHEAIRLMSEAVANVPDREDYARGLGEIYQAEAANAPENARLAMQWYTKASELGDQEAGYQVAMCYLTGFGVPMDVKAGVRRMQQLADAGMPEAQLAMGKAYLSGLWVERDVAKAKDYISNAAKQGNQEAAIHLKWLAVAAPPAP